MSGLFPFPFWGNDFKRKKYLKRKFITNKELMGSLLSWYVPGQRRGVDVLAEPAHCQLGLNTCGRPRREHIVLH